MAVVRSLLFLLILILVTPPYTLVVILCRPLPHHMRRRSVVPWVNFVNWMVKHLLGIPYHLAGAANIPDRAVIVLAKHQSAWETLAFQVLLPPQVWVLKRELLRIPFFGWGLAMMNPIAIDRSAGRKALKQMLEQGRDRLARGFWIVMFPEGTRIAPGQRGQYFVGGAWLATQTGAPVVPVAHNAGTVWPKGAFLKRPGTIVVSFGPVIDPAGRKAEELNRQVEAWIEAEVERLGSARC
jgi:1-acyl-sn-glycerol-3-phosphate acyltransferase